MSLFVSGTKQEFWWVKLSGDNKFLVLALDNELKFQSYVSNKCLKANGKVAIV